MQRRLGWKEVGDESDWHLYWTDTSVSMERVMRLGRVQKINHFAGMLEICRKKSLAKNIGRMQKCAPEDYAFSPRSFQLPAEMDDFIAMFEKGKRRTFIMKPDAGCQGKGITMVQTASAAESAMRMYQAHSCEHLVAQRYLHKPFLVNGTKFDLRIYVLVLSVDPLRIFLYDEGLVRFCTEPYSAPKSSNLDQVCMHLTNYALNKNNANFVANTDGVEGGDDGSKWALSAFYDYLSGEGHDVAKVKASINDVVVKTLISAQPLLAHNYRLCTAQHDDDDGFSCFELLGLDILLDWKLRPWLIEVNHSPSFTTDTPLDLEIKEALIEDTIALARIDSRAVRRAKAAEREDQRQRLYSVKRRSSVAGAESAESGGGGNQQNSSNGGGKTGSNNNNNNAKSSGNGISSNDKDNHNIGHNGKEQLHKKTASLRDAHSARLAARAAEMESREAYEDVNKGSFQRIYPVEGDDLLSQSLQSRYERLLEQSTSVFERFSCLGRTQAALDKKSADMKRVAERGGPPPPTVPRRVASASSNGRSASDRASARRNRESQNGQMADSAGSDGGSGSGGSGSATPTPTSGGGGNDNKIDENGRSGRVNQSSRTKAIRDVSRSASISKIGDTGARARLRAAGAAAANSSALKTREKSASAHAHALANPDTDELVASRRLGVAKAAALRSRVGAAAAASANGSPQASQSPWPAAPSALMRAAANKHITARLSGPGQSGIDSSSERCDSRGSGRSGGSRRRISGAPVGYGSGNGRSGMFIMTPAEAAASAAAVAEALGQPHDASSTAASILAARVNAHGNASLSEPSSPKSPAFAYAQRSTVQGFGRSTLLNVGGANSNGNNQGTLYQKQYAHPRSLSPKKLAVDLAAAAGMSVSPTPGGGFGMVSAAAETHKAGFGLMCEGVRLSSGGRGTGLSR